MFITAGSRAALHIREYVLEFGARYRFYPEVSVHQVLSIFRDDPGYRKNWARRSPTFATRFATDATSPTPPASDSPPGPDPALSATPSRSSPSISSPAGETTAFHASTGEKPTPVAATKPDLLATTNSLEAPTPVASSGASDADELASKKLQIKGADKAAQCRSDEGCRSFH
ncbi:hypothetical protein J6590_070137 [Homalodisca vitripennis]|nr:hypothetical protein J6590_070137 [Homalodisca vitripennis]